MRGRTLVWGALVLVLSAGAVAAQERPAASPGPPAAPGGQGGLLGKGALAPAFHLQDAAGGEFSYVGEGGGRPLLLAFISIFCEPCRIEMPVIQKLHEKYGGAGLDVVAVSLDGEPLRNSIAGFARQEKYTFRVLIDELVGQERFEAADPYGVAGTPTVYIVNAAGRVVFAGAGRVKEADLDRALRSVLKR